MGNLIVKESGEMINFISPNVSKITSFKVHFSPKQEGSGDPSPENVREIIGWNGVEGYGSGKNLFNGIMRKGSYNITTGEFENTNWYTSELLPVKPNTTYAFVKDGGLNTPPYSYQFDEQKQYISGTYTTSTKIITTRNETKYIAITISARGFNENYLDNFMICEGNNINAIRDITASTDWTEDVGTVYGGYVDLISGELVVNRCFLENENWTEYKRNNGFVAYRLDTMPMPKDKNQICKPISNIISIFTNFLSDNMTKNVMQITGTTLFVALAEGIDASEIQLSYELATPIHYQLTPQQLSTFKGQNNFWSDADYVEIEYELTETFDIQKAKRKIILNQPHVESASGDIVTFDTDMKGKLKECKVYFNPAQEGEGDPSPENVRNITGWNGVKIGLPDEYQEVEWIQSTEKEQFILLPYGFEETDTITITASIGTEYSTDKFIIAPTTWNDNSNRFAMVGVFQDMYCVGYGNRTTNYTRLEPLTNNDGNMHTWTFANKVFEITDLGLSIDVSNIAFGDITSNLKLFYGYKQNINGKLSYYKHAKLNGEVYEFIPCYRKSDGEIGLYDIRNHVFYTNDGTGSFLKGKDVNNITTNINWTDSAGTVYGGYVDVTSGELVVDRAIYTLDGSTLKFANVYNRGIKKVFGIVISGTHHTNTDSKVLISNMLTWTSDWYTSMPDWTYGSVVGVSSNHVFAFDDTVTTIEEANALLANWNTEGNPLTVTLLLATPIHYTLTPQQILTFKGTNNVYSDANGQTEIKYWKH